MTDAPRARVAFEAASMRIAVALAADLRVATGGREHVRPGPPRDLGRRRWTVAVRLPAVATLPGVPSMCEEQLREVAAGRRPPRAPRTVDS